MSLPSDLSSAINSVMDQVAAAASDFVNSAVSTLGSVASSTSTYLNNFSSALSAEPAGYQPGDGSFSLSGMHLVGFSSGEPQPPYRLTFGDPSLPAAGLAPSKPEVPRLAYSPFEKPLNDVAGLNKLAGAVLDTTQFIFDAANHAKAIPLLPPVARNAVAFMGNISDGMEAYGSNNNTVGFVFDLGVSWATAEIGAALAVSVSMKSAPVLGPYAPVAGAVVGVGTALYFEYGAGLVRTGAENMGDGFIWLDQQIESLYLSQQWHYDTWK